MGRRVAEVLLVLAAVAVAMAFLGRPAPPEPASAASPGDLWALGLPGQRIRPGMGVEGLGTVAGNRFNERGDRYLCYNPQTSTQLDVFLVGDVVDCVYAAQVEGSGFVLRVGDARARVRELLGQSTDPGTCSPHQPPEYELFRSGGPALEVTYQGDRVLRLSLFTPR